MKINCIKVNDITLLISVLFSGYNDNAQYFLFLEDNPKSFKIIYGIKRSLLSSQDTTFRSIKYYQCVIGCTELIKKKRQVLHLYY